MKRKQFLIQFTFISLIGSVFAQPNSNFHQIITDLDQVNQNPSVISFNNALEINNTGGHLQGIQKLIHNQNEYFILTGSSSGYSYYTIVKTGEENMVISVNKILEKPFKHAGGFQIHNNLMAIGVEDNDAKTRSKVFIFHLENPDPPPEEPLAIIDRMGTHKRATAGCVGIIAIHEKILVVVGDWDTAHSIAQDIPDSNGSRVHAYLHRKEGDQTNASYWYSRAGKPKPAISLEQEWEQIAIVLLDAYQ